jgi:GTPase
MSDRPKKTPRPKAAPHRPGPPTSSTLIDGLPRVVVVGCPNVGKSTLFNRLAGRRDAVVDSWAGVTRDWRQAGCDWIGRSFQIIDTGGIDEGDPAPMARQVAQQAHKAIEEADLILFVVDATIGVAPADAEVAESLRRARCPIFVVANKCDRDAAEIEAQVLWGLGLGDVIPVSALHGIGIGELLDAIVANIPEAPPIDHNREAPAALCILGRPNVGKSSILNALLGEERVIVHDRPGTTRDPIDTFIEVDGEQVVLIDTAGLRKRGRMRAPVEHYSQIRALQAADRSDVAIVVCDATEGVTESDISAIDQAARAHCATLVVINKWDLDQPDLDHIRGRLRAKTRQRPPIEVCSAVTGEGLHRILRSAMRLVERSRTHQSTHVLNTTIRELAAERPGPMKDGRRLSMRYMVQTGTSPPKFRLDVNDRTLMTRDYGFWIENRLRQRLDLDGVPMEIEVRGRVR